MTSWKLIKNDQLILTGTIDSVIGKLRSFGDDFRLRVNIEECVIEIILQKEEFDRSSQIRKGMKQRQLEKFRRYPNFIEDPSFKFCTNCKTSRTLDEFGYRKDSADGRARQCMRCVNKKAKKYRKKRKQSP